MGAKEKSRYTTLKNVLLIGLVLLANNDFETILEPLVGAFFANSTASSCPAPQTIIDNPNTWHVPPEGNRPGWLESDYLVQLGVEIPPILDFPGGVRRKINILALCHPDIKAVAGEQMQHFADQDIKKGKALPPLLGDSLRKIFNSLKERVVFPANYSERDRVQVLLDMTTVTSAAITDLDLSAQEVKERFGVHFPQGSENVSFFYQTIEEHVRIYPLPDEFCFSPQDLLVRCIGADRDLHSAAHRENVRQFLDYLETNNPDLIKTGKIPAQVVFQTIKQLPISKEGKVELLTNIVGGNWEKYEFLRDVLAVEFKNLSPLEIAANPFAFSLTMARVIAHSYRSGDTDPAVVEDYEANHAGAKQALALRELQSFAAVYSYFDQLNSSDINTTNRPISDQQKRLILTQFYQKANTLVDLFNDINPSISNQRLFAQAAKLYRTLERRQMDTLPPAK